MTINDLKNLFKGAAIVARCDQAQSARKVLRGLAEQGHAAGDGAADLSPENCHYCFHHVEERSVIRRPTSETIHSLSVLIESAPWRDLRWWAVGFSRHSGARASLSW